MNSATVSTALLSTQNSTYGSNHQALNISFEDSDVINACPQEIRSPLINAPLSHLLLNPIDLNNISIETFDELLENIPDSFMLFKEKLKNAKALCTDAENAKNKMLAAMIVFASSFLLTFARPQISPIPFFAFIAMVVTGKTNASKSSEATNLCKRIAPNPVSHVDVLGINNLTSIFNGKLSQEGQNSLNSFLKKSPDIVRKKLQKADSLNVLCEKIFPAATAILFFSYFYINLNPPKIFKDPDMAMLGITIFGSVVMPGALINGIVQASVTNLRRQAALEFVLHPIPA